MLGMGLVRARPGAEFMPMGDGPGLSSHSTPRWRKADSNSWSHLQGTLTVGRRRGRMKSRRTTTMILPAQAIRRAAPIAEMVERRKAFGLTYGLGPAGYDVRINCGSTMIEAGQFLLAATVERFQMPGDLMGIVHDK